ncbi:hypothetical protein JCM14719A_07590 [Calditerricola satsumensis]|uniref:Uncharacterized protein n=1 Tax=Calditerricola satsumensis TaxID=373054 RepID=A0A8J3FDZ7_9BACI|nr:hypothetical protein GCM10007043_10060 [Calditerricola satsumensis]
MGKSPALTRKGGPWFFKRKAPALPRDAVAAVDEEEEHRAVGGCLPVRHRRRKRGAENGEATSRTRHPHGWRRGVRKGVPTPRKLDDHTAVRRGRWPPRNPRDGP